MYLLGVRVFLGAGFGARRGFGRDCGAFAARRGAFARLTRPDVVMPGMDGYNLVRTLRERMPEVKVILMSGYAEDAFQDEIDKDDTLHFLPKPFTLKTLVGKVKEIIVSDTL